MKLKKMLRGAKWQVVLGICLAMGVSMGNSAVWASASSDNLNGTFTNPVIYADVPDDSVIRVGDTYYMASTTMHLTPGCPIMKSKDLVNWEVVNYVYDTLTSNENTNLQNGKDMYGKGSWAASLKYNKGTYYISFMSYTTGKTYIYQTKDIENGQWTRFEINGCYHDMSLLFDDNGKVYMLYGSSDIRYVELNSDVTGIKMGGASGLLFSGKNLVGNGLFEGTNAIKLNGYYYVFNIAWPGGKPRTQYVSRSKSLNGPWESRIILQDNFDNVSGVAQGGIIDTEDGKWYGMLFQDHGPVGRCPVLVPVTWIDGWPMMGTNGKVQKTMAKPISTGKEQSIVKSDEFDGESGKTYKSGLDLVWQWNHNPDNNSWSLKEKPGCLRLKTGEITNSLTSARNVLTQRTYGPTCSGKVAIDVSHMKNGDIAGLSAFSYKYGYVGIKMENNMKKIVMVNASNNSMPQEIESVNLNADKVYLKIDFNFEGGNRANFYYSIDGSNWYKIGNSLAMEYTLDHFMGYRFGLFNYATKMVGGYVDFDYFRVSDELKGAVAEKEETKPSEEIKPNANYATVKDGWYYIKNTGSGKYLQVAGDKGGNAVNVEIGTLEEKVGQKWYLTNVGDGYFTLKNGHDYMLDLVCGRDEDKTNIQVYTANGLGAQQFKLLPTAQKDVYGIVTKSSTDIRGLDVEERGIKDGSNVIQYFYSGAANQIWTFEECKVIENNTQAPSEMQKPEPVEADTVAIKIVSEWGDGATADVTVTNTTNNDLNGWTCTFTTDRPIKSIWNAQMVSQEGNTYTITNPEWQTQLAKGEKYTFGVSLGSGNTNVKVTNVTLK